MINGKKKIKSANQEQLWMWSYGKAITSLFVVAEQSQSVSAAEDFKDYIDNFLQGSDPRYSESIEDDVFALQRVNKYLQGVCQGIDATTEFSLVTWLKLAHDYWASFGVRDEKGDVDPVLESHRKAFQARYVKHRSKRNHRSQLALVVPDNIYSDFESGKLGIDSVEMQENCYAIDVFLASDLDKNWLSKQWRVCYVDYQSAPKRSSTAVVPKKSRGPKKMRKDYLSKKNALREKLGPQNCDKMEAALRLAIEDGGFDGLLKKSRVGSTQQYRFNGKRVDLYKKLNSWGYDITESKTSGLKLISFYVRCRVWD